MKRSFFRDRLGRKDRSKASVAIFGGGAAGLTAAHELAERGFQVSIYEAKLWGGKLGGSNLENTAKGTGRRDLPVEHGFHFFPSFYRHVPDTMRRIPLPSGVGTVYDRLVAGAFEEDARGPGRSWAVPSRFSFSLKWLYEFLATLPNSERGIPPRELAFVLGRQLKFMSACDERREQELGGISWWNWNDSDRMSPALRGLVDQMAARTLLAVPPQLVDVPTMAQAFLNMSYSALLPGQNIDRALNADATTAWVNPWIDHLRSLGVELNLPAKLVDVEIKDGRIGGAVIETQEGGRKEIVADYYVMALPLEAMRVLLHAQPELARLAPSLSTLGQLQNGWMNGLSFFLSEPLPIVRGHISYQDSAWALTSVSQSIYWSDMSLLGNGSVKEVLSVIVSDWNRPGSNGKTAKECTKQEFVQEVMVQLNAEVPNEEDKLHWRKVLHVGVDANLRFPASEGDSTATSRVVNTTPLFTPTVGTRQLRPRATTELENFFVASDYVSTYISFGSAEGANQAGRMAANGVLRASGSKASRARIYPPLDIALLAPIRWLDRYRYLRGLPQLTFPLPGLGPYVPSRESTEHQPGMDHEEFATAAE